MDWNKIPNFERREFDDPLHPGSGDNIDRNIVLILQELRLITRVPIIIHSGAGGAVDMDGSHGHSDNSYHLHKNGCKAVDFHLNCQWPTRVQVYYVLNSGFSGIGIYYDWTFNEKPTLGFHGDTRQKDRSQVWTEINGERTYFLK